MRVNEQPAQTRQSASSPDDAWASLAPLDKGVPLAQVPVQVPAEAALPVAQASAAGAVAVTLLPVAP